MKNASFNTHDVKKCCEQKLDIDFRTKSKEFNGWFTKHDRKLKRITIPKGRKPIGRGLYQSMATQLGLSVAKFDDLLDCPLDKQGYQTILEEAGVLLT